MHTCILKIYTCYKEKATIVVVSHGLNSSLVNLNTQCHGNRLNRGDVEEQLMLSTNLLIPRVDKEEE